MVIPLSDLLALSINRYSFESALFSVSYHMNLRVIKNKVHSISIFGLLDVVTEQEKSIIAMYSKF